MATDYYRVSNVVRSNIDSFGLVKTIYDLFYKIANRIWLFRVLKCMVISKVDPNYLKSAGQYQYLFLDTEMLYKFAQRPEYDLSEAFLRHAEERGDECYAILDGDTLASYGWYSNRPVNVGFEGDEGEGETLRLHFNDRYIYMYKGYTHTAYRGQRLHAIGMTHALEAYLKRGFKGLVSYVEANNYRSLKSVYRMGYQDFGKISIFRILGKYLIYNSKGCKEYGFKMEVL